ncbi:MAG: biopolymer transporter ExbD [Myxococcota bacterium]
MFWSWFLGRAFAQDVPPAPTPDPSPPEAEAAPAPRPGLELTGMGRRSFDAEVFVRYDGNLYWQDELVLADDLEALLRERLAAAPDTRVVITGDAQAPYDALVRVVVLARAAGAERTALEVLAPELDLTDLAEDPLFPEGGVTVLDSEDDARAADALKPRRGSFPQDPYANTSSYTAYALEWGETKIGLGSVTTGVAPRVQLGTAPLLYTAAVLNANLKADVVREGPLDVALGVQYYHVPVTSSPLAGAFLGGRQGDNVAVDASYLGLGVTGSLQVLRPWSVHLQAYWARPSVKGEIRFDDLPEVLLPGLSLGGNAAVGLGVTGDLGVLNLATDVRFNRRDSVFAWLRYPFYGRVRGRTSGAIGGFEDLSNADFIVAYGDWIPLADSFSFAVGYDASWRHFALRTGLGVSAVRFAWVLQAFELSYRFGGATRRQERRIRRGFQQAPDDATE